MNGCFEILFGTFKESHNLSFSLFHFGRTDQNKFIQQSRDNSENLIYKSDAIEMEIREIPSTVKTCQLMTEAMIQLMGLMTEAMIQGAFFRGVLDLDIIIDITRLFRKLKMRINKD